MFQFQLELNTDSRSPIRKIARNALLTRPYPSCEFQLSFALFCNDPNPLCSFGGAREQHAQKKFFPLADISTHVATTQSKTNEALRRPERRPDTYATDRSRTVYGAEYCGRSGARKTRKTREIVMRCLVVAFAFALAAWPGLLANAKLEPRVECSDESINVELDTSGVKFTDVYLENLKGFPMCQPEIKDNSVKFAINLKDEFRCGASRMTNQMTGEKTYFQRIILENDDKDKREVILVQCRNRVNRTRRQAFPNWPDIVEPDHINITEYIEARAPIPNLDLGIKQNGRMLDTTYNVQPGTPLEMVIYLDPVSKATYGILASFLKVSDSAGQQEEVVVMNGCSIDPYIFSNFVTPDKGDSLSATFKAFKFPDSNYVMFSGTVSICINQCKSIPCGNGQFGHGRRRRRDAEKDPNAVYSVDMTTMLKVQFNDDLFTLQKGSVAAEFNNTPALGMNHIEGVDMSAEEYSSSTSATAASSAAVFVALLVGFVRL